ncbi:MAG: DUF4179 domain-containing protein [Clostridia bacterium]|nr:DUF4179 domain-containing protein [Clostridia bacterium]
MDKRKDIDLRSAIPETPDMCRDAVLQAVSTYREERTMRRPYKMILAAALVLALLCGTAYAIANYYSVREYVALGKTSEAFENAIVPLEKAITVNGVTVTLGDAVFDGREMGLTMSMEAEEGAESLYFLPQIEAFSGEKRLELNDYKAEGMDAYWGMLYPYMTTAVDYMLPSRFGFSAEVQDVPTGGEVTWRYTLHVLKPVGKLVEQCLWDDEKETYEQWEQSLRDLHAQGEISVLAGYSLTDYLTALNVSGQDSIKTDRIVETGAFEKLDTIVFEFTTPVPERTSIVPDETYQLEGYIIKVKSITVGMMQVDYELEACYDAPQPNEHELEQSWALYDQNGTELRFKSGGWSLAEDKVTCKVTGSASRISDEPLTAITFRLDHDFTIDPDDTAEDMPFFIVQLTK